MVSYRSEAVNGGNKIKSRRECFTIQQLEVIKPSCHQRPSSCTTSWHMAAKLKCMGDEPRLRDTSRLAGAILQCAHHHEASQAREATSMPGHQSKRLLRLAYEDSHAPIILCRVAATRHFGNARPVRAYSHQCLGRRR